MPPQPGQPNQPIVLTDGTHLDPKVVKVMRAIKQVESGGDYNNRSGDGGSSAGAYQWNNDKQKLAPGQLPSHFKQAAMKYGLDPNDFSPANQNKVAYHQVMEYKNQGLQPDEIDALWNGAHKDGGGRYVHNSSTRAEEFRAALLGQPTYNPTPFSGGGSGTGMIDFSGYQNNQNAPQDPNAIGTQLSQRGTDVSAGLTEAGQGLGELGSGQIGSGLMHAGSGALQAVGGVAGGIGDIATKGLELIPGVKGVENLIGGAVGAAAKTAPGQAVVHAAQDFSQAHPEISKDVGSAVNIASVIPMFKAASMAAGAGKGAVAKAFEGKLANQAAEELHSSLQRTVPGRNLMANATKKGFSPVSDAIDNRILPDVVEHDGKFHWNTAAADEEAARAEAVQEENLRHLLTKAGTVEQPGKTGFITDSPTTLASARELALKQATDSAGMDAMTAQHLEKSINELFDAQEKQFGKYHTLNAMTDMKRDIRSAVKFDTPSVEKDARFYAGQGLMSAIEKEAAARGIKGVRDVNKTMARIINVRRMLSHLEGRPIPSSKIGGKWVREGAADVAGGLGEAAGRFTGIPLAGAFAGRSLGRAFLNKAPGGALKALRKTERPIMPQLIQSAKQATKGLAAHQVAAPSR